ncbi:MAG: hypothetical protein IJ415_02010 [Clostridia bacterium]|nr:hypothetical protein [Clostridia bacterium]
MDQFNIKRDKTNKFLRSINKEDVKYRKIKRMTFEKELKMVLGDECLFCFHGTPIWNAQKILQSGNISAEIDRFGAGEDILNMPGQISVSTINNLWFTVQHHADLLNFKYPAGCIFVILPKNEEEIKSSREKNIIANVDFKQNPERLKAIITTPENVEKVKFWIKEYGLNVKTNIVVDYDEFISKSLEFSKDNTTTI